jgi:hypothetical protein
VRPATARFETLFSNDRLEGMARLAGTLSGEVAEHAYWGGARDRLPLAQTDPLAPGDPPAVAGDGMRQVVRGQDNLCLIRSGQDWSDTDGGERRMYLDDVEPVLRAGMDFLRDEGSTVGCYANRYMRVIDNQGDPVDKSFGMSWWHSLADLDRWAKDHPTHKAIFGQAMKYLSALGPAAGCVFTTRSPSPQPTISTSSTSAATPAPACSGSSRPRWLGRSSPPRRAARDARATPRRSSQAHNRRDDRVEAAEPETTERSVGAMKRIVNQ